MSKTVSSEVHMIGRPMMSHDLGITSIFLNSYHLGPSTSGFSYFVENLGSESSKCHSNIILLPFN